jgi:hypothetical protein
MPYALQALIFERFQRANFSKELPNGWRFFAFVSLEDKQE